jgi:hypothetical protein
LIDGVGFIGFDIIFAALVLPKIVAVTTNYEAITIQLPTSQGPHR